MSIEMLPRTYLEADVRMIVNMMSDEQLELYKEAFATYDKQKNGTIRMKALVKVLRTLGENPTEDKVEAIQLQLASKGKVHIIDFIDFLRIMFDVTNGCCFQVDEVVQEAFNMFDKDLGGSITHDEFREKMLASGADIDHAELNEIIAAVDTNCDGVIDLREFSVMLKHMW